MKKRNLLIISLLIIFTLTIGFIGCKDKDEKISSTEYVVTFDCLGGCEISSQTVQANSCVQKPEDPKKEGYKFIGWYVDSSFSSLYDFSKKVDSNITLYARWQKDSIVITFLSNGGSEVSPITVNRNETIKKPSNPIRRGYNFIGWYLDEALTKVYDFSYVPDLNINLYAKWDKKPDGDFKVTLYGNGGSGTNLASYDNEYGSYLPDDWVKEGYDFKGWYDNAEFNGEKITKIEAYTTKELSFYARWELSQTKVEIIDGNEIINTYVLHTGESLDLKPLDNKKGYNFIGWAYKPEGDATLIDKVQQSEKKIVKVFARWEAVECEISLYYQVGMEPVIEYREFGSITILPMPKDDNYYLEGWYTKEDYSGTKYYEYIEINEEKMSFYAKWNPKQFNIKLDLNEGYLVGSKNSIILKHTYGEKLTLPTNVKRDGYDFVGWYTYENGQKEYLTFIPELSSGNQTVHAEYKNLEYSIYLNLEGGTLLSEAPVKYEHGSAVYLPICVKEGYDFKGWSEKKDQKDNPVTYISYKDYGDKNYYAIFEVKRFTLAMHEYEDMITLQKIEYGSTIELSNPVRHGYKFEKWYSDVNCTQEFTMKTMPAQSTDIYAKWIPEKFVLNFDANGGKPVSIPSVEVDCGSSVQEFKPQDPTYPNKRFVGWFELDAEKPFNFDTMPDRNVVLYAKWGSVLSGLKDNKINYYDGDIKLNLEPSKYKEGEGAYLPETTKEGYIFAGWFDNKELQGNPISVITSTNNKNQELYAKWMPCHSYIRYVLTDNSNYYIDLHTYGKETILPTDYTQDGLKFVAWYDNPERNGTPITMIEANNLQVKTFYAKWEPASYTVNLDLNGGIGDKTILEYQYLQGIQLPINYVKEGYIFNGWKDKATNEEVEIISKTDFGDKNLIIDWAPVEYNVYLIGNNGEGSVVYPYYYGEEKVLPKDWTREGCTFNGWYYDPECLDGPYESIPAEQMGDVSFFAMWSPNQYSITLVGEGQVTNPDEVINKYYYGFNTYLPVNYEREGYIFAGWYTDRNCTYENKISIIDNTMYGDKILYSKWIPEVYTITYRTNFGSPIDSIILNTGDKITMPNIPIRENKVFAGWFMDKELTIPFDLTIMPAKDLTLYVKWDDGAYITYVYGDGKKETKQCTPAQSIVLADDVKNQTWNRPMFDFEGWYFDENFTYKCDSLLVMNQHYTVYAKWTPRGFMQYKEKFAPAIHTDKYIIEVESDEELIDLMDFVFFNYITHDVGIKYKDKNLTEDDWNNLIIRKIYQGDKTTFASSILKHVDVVNGIAYIAADLDADYGSDIVIETKDVESGILPKIANGLVPVYTQKRPDSFNNFKIENRENTLNVETSDQLFYAVQYGYKPICKPSSPAEKMLKAAKRINIEILDDDMSNFEKVYALFIWFVENINYDNKGVFDSNVNEHHDDKYLLGKTYNAESWHMEGVFNKNIAVCDGMSKAFVLMCGLEDIPCIRVVSRGHAWNKVYIDLDNNGIAEWYGLDVTWGSKNISPLGYTDHIGHFLFTDRVKSQKGANQLNFLDIEGVTEVNPFEVVTYVDDDTNETHDCSIENRSELNSILKEVINNIDNIPNKPKLVSLCIEINYPRLDLMSSIIFEDEVKASLEEIGKRQYFDRVVALDTYTVMIYLQTYK